MIDWEDFVSQCKNCNRCGLSQYRKNVVLGRGKEKPCPIMFVGEGPGEQEDIEGEAFVGRAGQLLNLLLTALEFNKEDYYITNIVKCRPPNNRIPIQEEVDACMPWLRYQVKMLSPSIIVCLGATSAKALIDPNVKITRIRGSSIRKGDFLIFPTYHPAAVLRDNNKRIDFFTDIKKVRDRLIEIKAKESKNT